MKTLLPEIISEVKSFEFINWSDENYLMDLSDKWKYSLAAFLNDIICGFSINSSKKGLFYIHFFYVFRKFRQNEIGKSLLNSCENLSLTKGIKVLQLKCHRDNANAKRFYIRHGFNITGMDKNTYYIMEKKL